ncbi:DgyrCDS8452 [Dimorphilus gyrociliatus]|uniref:U3 small nucleolar RNA-associated protein 15 homolog n=1 Tax=Dimorphilus gyrociliatus TaxID=2664684 RepID=A0A7I8VVQ5_9ANNE|nr:DgyrCDS8452 [Dimorphilus gyrociliatus]
MSSFKTAELCPKQKTEIVSEYWDNYRQLNVRKETGAANWVEYHPEQEDVLLFTCGSRVSIVDSNMEPTKTFSRFKEDVYSARWRSDGSLITCGGQQGKLHVLHPQHGELRRIKAHKQAIRSCGFTKDNHRIISGSDDNEVKIWDIATGECVQTFRSHSDHVRSVSPSSTNSQHFVSSSYDHTIKLWDCRHPDTEVLTMQHNTPVECVLFANELCISAGGNSVKIWDLLAGGRLLKELRDHHKTPTCVKFSSGRSYMLTTGLDKRILIYDWNGFEYAHSFKTSAPALSVAVSKGDKRFSVGLEDGLITTFEKKEKLEKWREPKEEIEEDWKPKNMSKADKHLRHFEHSKALDFVLKKNQGGMKVDQVISVLQELIRRDVLHAAIASRSEKSSLEHLLKFVLYNIGVQRYTAPLIEVANVILDIELQTEEVPQPEVVDLLNRLRRAVKSEIEMCDKIAQMRGALEIIMNCNSA